MSAPKQAFDPCQYGDPRIPDGDLKEKKVMRDEEKSREQMIEELLNSVRELQSWRMPRRKG